MPLGLTATHERDIKSGIEYNHLFPAASGQYAIVKKTADVNDTIHLMREIVANTLNDTKALYNQVLKTNDSYQYCENIWNFLYNHIQYKLDKAGTEELRRPRRSWADRTSGIDCDCFSIFVGSLLVHKKIPFSFRVTAYGGDFQHVYVIAHLPSRDVVIDCVIDEFDYEKPFTKKLDYKMKHDGLGIPVALLGNPSTYGCACSKVGITNSLQGLGTTDDIATEALQVLKQHLIDTRNHIIDSPESVLLEGGARAWISMIDHAIANWENPILRDEALNLLAKEELRWSNQSGVSVFSDYEGVEGLGKIKVKNFFNKVKNAVDNVSQAAKNAGDKIGEKVQNAANKVGAGVKNAVNNAVKAVAKYNPINLTMRGGFLLALRTNFMRMGTKLLPALTNDTRKYNSKQIAQSKELLRRFEGIFHFMGGEPERIHKPVLEGKAAKKSGLKGLGQLGMEPATLTALIAAAPAIIKALSEMQSVQNSSSFGSTDTDMPGIDDLGKEDPEFDADAESQLFNTIDNVDTDEEGNVNPTQAANLIKKILDFILMRNNRNQAKSGGGGEFDFNDQSRGGEGEGDSTENPIVDFVKNNPGKTILGVAIVGTGAVLAVSQKARKAVGLAGVNKRTPSTKKSKTNYKTKALAKSKVKVKKLLLT